MKLPRRLKVVGSINMGTESADLIDAWHDLYVMLGTSSAALIGLLFIATSIHLGEVVSNPGFRVRSYNQTLYLLTLLVEAILILVPQPVSFLGAELMVLNLVGLWIALSTSYTFIYKHRDDRHRGGMKMSRAIPLTVAYLLGIAVASPSSRALRGDVHCDSFVHRTSRHGRVGCLVDHGGHGAKAIGRRAKGKGRQLTRVRFGTKRHRLVRCTCLLLTQSGQA